MGILDRAAITRIQRVMGHLLEPDEEILDYEITNTIAKPMRYDLVATDRALYAVGIESGRIDRIPYQEIAEVDLRELGGKVLEVTVRLTAVGNYAAIGFQAAGTWRGEPRRRGRRQILAAYAPQPTLGTLPFLLKQRVDALVVHEETREYEGHPVTFQWRPLDVDRHYWHINVPGAVPDSSALQEWMNQQVIELSQRFDLEG